MLPESFLSKILITEDDHWLWVAGKDGRGYGVFRSNGRPIKAHRFAWIETKGPIPTGIDILHKNSCHRRDCCNPAHLYLGTDKDNVKDQYEFGNAVAGRVNKAKIHCPQGHEFNLENTYIDSKNKRHCNICSRKRALDRYYRIKKEKGDEIEL